MLKGLFDASYKELKKNEKIAEKILNRSSVYKNMSDDELRHQTDIFKEKINQGETVDDLIIDAFAVVVEAADRVLHMRPFKVQIEGALALHGGNVAEMKTGEGKTLTSTMVAYLNALNGEGVHVVTVNEYLAQRDATEMGVLFKWLGLSVGLSLNDMDLETKKEQYLCDITYSTASEFGFDYLRDNMAVRPENIVQKKLNFVIVDEADSILIDEARTPLIISGAPGIGDEKYIKADRIVKSLIKNSDYTINLKDKYVVLTAEGINKVEHSYGINDLYSSKNSEILHLIDNSLRANYIMKKNVDYVVMDEKVVIIDQFTGRLMQGRQFSDGLHQSLEAKENITINEEVKTIATITIQNYFRLYKKLSGMTGTAKTEETEFQEIYNMFVVCIPTNKPMIRNDERDLYFLTEEDKFNAVALEIKRLYDKGQPVLIGTISIEVSEYLSSLITKLGIPHNVLNANRYQEEANIVAHAGEYKAVTIATNMAGRGTDIKLAEGISELGGLFVIGTERHEARRIDNQLRGRSGRQGDPGTSRFYVSLDDEIFARNVEDNVKLAIDDSVFTSNIGINSKVFEKIFENAQIKVENINYSIRKTVLQYDEVMKKQRELIYKQRNKILLSDNCIEILNKMFKTFLNKNVQNYLNRLNPKKYEFCQLINSLNITESLLTEDLIANVSYKEIEAFVNEQYIIKTNAFINKTSLEIFNEMSKNIMIRAIDINWMKQIEKMDELKQAVRFKGYGSVNALSEYTDVGLQLLGEMLSNIEKDSINMVITNINRIKIIS